MATTIKVTYNKKTYTLGFTRATAKMLESRGFDFNEIGRQGLNMVSMLFYHSFLANQKKMDPKIAEEIWDKVPNKSDLLTKLVEMYMEPLNAFMDEPEEDEGNAMWTVE